MTILAGNVVKVQVTFKDESREKRDPSAVSVTVQQPDLTETTYVYGTDAQVVRTSTGIYYILIDTTAEVGQWQFKWVSTGSYQAVGQTSFTVVDTDF